MNQEIVICPLSKELFSEAVDLVLKAGLDTIDEIKHHLQHLESHYVALNKGSVIGVIGWYQDNVNYANFAMGKNFPGETAYWVGFFAVNKEFQDQGIGNSLLNKLEKIIKNKNANELWVSSVPETKEYYVKHGFKVLMTGKIGENNKFFCVKHLS